MDKLNDVEQKSLLHELNQGRELANQLKNHIGPIPSKETCEALVQKILSSYDKALAVLNWTGLLQEPSPVIGLVESHQSFNGVSPKSEGACADPKNHCHKNVFKKRKTLPRWSEKVRVGSGTGLEGALDDRYSWRKYGQKDILGATHPRAYYRCTYRHTKGCAATKQVQRSDEDPSMFEVRYKGKHTCNQASNSTSTRVSLESETVTANRDNLLQQLEQKHNPDKDIVFHSGQEFKTETEELDLKEDVFPSFSFPSTSMESETLGSLIFSGPLEGNIFLDSYSLGFLSPATSESNYLSASPCQMKNYGSVHEWQGSDCDLVDINSTSTSVSTSPFELDFSIDQMEFDLPIEQP